MVGFEQGGRANLWKSGRLFSTGTKEAALMLGEPGLNPRGPAGQLGYACARPRAASKRREAALSLSTAFAEGECSSSTGGRGFKEVALG